MGRLLTEIERDDPELVWQCWYQVQPDVWSGRCDRETHNRSGLCERHEPAILPTSIEP